MKDIRPGSLGSNPEELTVSGGALFFSATDGSGRKQWKSDGTEAGTRQVKDIDPGPPGSEPHHLTAVGDQVYFVADDGVHGRELWVSDGTEAGTRLVEDIALGQTSSLPLWLRAEGAGLVFTASDGLHGMELWRSNGTGLGTRMLQDISPGPPSSNPAELTSAGPNLYFAANDGVIGYELWAIPKTALTTFADVPTSHWAWPFIEALAVSGLTGGCGGEAFCPEGPVTRAQTAVFLVRGIHGVTFTPPPATGTVFADVPVGYWAPWIEQLAAEGITGGCAPGLYCPDNPVNRVEMAVFLTRTFNLPLP